MVEWSGFGLVGPLTREHQGCPYPGAHQKEEKERNRFASLVRYSSTAQPNLLVDLPM
jgi:hypothetical protein